MNKEDIKGFCKNPQLVHSDGMTMKEISLALGVKQVQVNNDFNKACFKLRTLFKEKGLTEDLEDYLAEYCNKEIGCE